MKEKKFKSNKSAQQLAEFLLVAPLLMIFILILVEFAFAINARMTLATAVENSVFKARQNASSDTLQTEIQSYIKTYLTNHNIPNASSVTVNSIKVGDNTMVLANYTYIPAFRLSAIFGNIIPAKYDFTSYQLVDSSYLNSTSGFNSPLSTTDLSSFGFVGIGSDSRLGVIRNQNIDGIDARTLTAFMVNFGTLNGKQVARLFNWFGTDLLPKNTILDMTTGYLMKTSDNGATWSDTTTPYTWYLIAKGYTNAVYTPIIDGTTAPAPYATYDLTKGTNGSWIVWCNQGTPSAGTCSTTDTDDFAASPQINNMIKRVFGGLYGLTPQASGTFEASSGTNDAITANNIKLTTIWNKVNNYYLKIYVLTGMTVPTTLPTGGETMPDGSTLNLSQSNEYSVLMTGAFSPGNKVTNTWQ